MTSRSLLWATVSLLLPLAGCESILGDFPSTNDVDGSTDASAEASDRGADSSTVAMQDSSVDGGSTDSSSMDGTVSDTGIGVEDTGAIDSGIADSSTADVHEAGPPTSCKIGGTTYTAGQQNPSNVCQVCTPTASATAWSDGTDGTSCSSGEICHTGACVAGCEVNATFYASLAAEPNDPCETCQPSASTTAFTSVSDGTTCGNGQVCASGQCGTQCDIGGTLYTTGAANPANACQSCQPGQSTSAWSTDSDGTNCGSNHVCTSGNCVLGCYISGTFYASGAANPSNACQACQPTDTTTTWTNDTDGTGCGTGMVCKTGTCEAACFIGGAVVASGTQNPATTCQTCQPSVSTIGYSDVTNGTSCGTGEVCNAGACDSGCYIGGTYYAAGAVDPSNECLECTPASSTTAWSDVTNLTSCGTNSVCCGGTCAACSLPANSNATCSGTTCTDTCKSGYGTSCSGSPCTDLQIDANNCGTCGHSCQGGACSGGQCQAVTVVPSTYLGNNPTDFDTNGTILVWVDAAFVWEMPSLGAAPIALTTTAQANTPIYVGLDGAGPYVDWIQSPSPGANAIGSATLGMASSGAIVHTFATGTVATGIVVNGSGAGSFQTQVTTSSTVAIDVCNYETGGCTQEDSFASTSAARGIVYGDDYVVVGDYANNTVKMLYLGTLTFTNVPNQTFLNYFAADNTYVYWYSEQSSNIINRAAYGSTTVTQIATNAYGLNRFASDGANIYFSDTNHNLVAMPNGGGTETTLAAGAYPEFMKYVNGAIYFYGGIGGKDGIFRIVYP